MTESSEMSPDPVRSRGRLAAAVVLAVLLVAVVVVLSIRAWGGDSSDRTSLPLATGLPTVSPPPSASPGPPSPTPSSEGLGTPTAQPRPPGDRPEATSPPRPTPSAGSSPGTGTSAPPAPTKPGQTIQIAVPTGEFIRMTGDASVPAHSSLGTFFTPRPVAVETGAPVSVSVLSESCTAEGDDVTLNGSIGDTCVLRVQAPGDDAYLPFDGQLTIRFEPAYHVSWKVVAAPASPGCYQLETAEPATTPIGEITLEAAGTTTSLEGETGVGVIEASDGLRWDQGFSDAARVSTITLWLVAGAAEGSYTVQIGHQYPGQLLTTGDPRTILDFTAKASCP